MATDQELSTAFKSFTDQVVVKAQAVNAKREQMETMINKQTQNGVIVTDGTSQGGNGTSIRDYEESLENLKTLVENTSPNLKVQYQLGGAKHYIRALDIQLDHNNSAKDYLITGVVVRGLISVSANDGNQAPTYSSKSSSSSTPP